MTDWIDRPLAQVAAALRDRKLKAVELAEQALARHARWDERLQAYMHWDAEAARRHARAADAATEAGIEHGPLGGIPVSVKDLFGVAGMPTFSGSPKRLPAEWEAEGTFVRVVRSQGAVVPGKTRMVEFAFGGLGPNGHWPVPRNPWDAEHHRVPGGSSSGAGVSLAEGSAMVALGTDTAGSVRVPAAVTGCVGIKTSAGRWPLDGVVPLSATFDTIGLLTRSAADLAFAFAAVDARVRGGRGVLALPQAEVAGLRIGLAPRFYWDGCAPGINEAVEEALQALERAGARRSDHGLPEYEPAMELFRAGGLASPQLYSFLKNVLPDWLASLDPGVAARVGDGERMAAHEYIRRLGRFAALGDAANARLEGIDVLALPTVSITAPRLADVGDAESYRQANMGALRNTALVNLLDLCSVTLPVGKDRAGVPVGLQLIARRGEDARLVAIARAVERVLGTPAERLGKPPLGG